MAQTADRVFTELTPEQQRTARRVFLRLVTVVGAVVARRGATPDELETATDLDRPSEVTERFAAARLLTLGEDTVEAKPVGAGAPSVAPQSGQCVHPALA